MSATSFRRSKEPSGMAFSTISPYSSGVLNLPVYCNTYCTCWGSLSELMPVFPGAASMFCLRMASVTSWGTML